MRRQRPSSPGAEEDRSKIRRLPELLPEAIEVGETVTISSGEFEGERAKVVSIVESELYLYLTLKGEVVVKTMEEVRRMKFKPRVVLMPNETTTNQAPVNKEAGRRVISRSEARAAEAAAILKNNLPMEKSRETIEEELCDLKEELKLRLTDFRSIGHFLNLGRLLKVTVPQAKSGEDAWAVLVDLRLDVQFPDAAYLTLFCPAVEGGVVMELPNREIQAVSQIRVKLPKTGATSSHDKCLILNRLVVALRSGCFSDGIPEISINSYIGVDYNRVKMLVEVMQSHTNRLEEMNGKMSEENEKMNGEIDKIEVEQREEAAEGGKQLGEGVEEALDEGMRK